MVDGVPVYAVARPPGTAEDTCSLTLSFAVGGSYEDLPQHGITHLVEHLTLFPLGRQAHFYNGFVEPTRTSFVAQGSPAECVSFLTAVQQSLANLPLARLEPERRVLEVEASRRTPGLADQLLTYRFGSKGPGVYGFSEFGLRWLDAGAVTAWRERTMHRRSATLVAVGVPLEELPVQLPEPTAHPAPMVDDGVVEAALPKWFSHATGPHVAVGMTHTRSAAASAAVRILAHRLHDKLRTELAISYGTSIDVAVVAPGLRHVVVMTDAQPEHAAVARDEIYRALYGLATSGPTDAELADDAAALVRVWSRSRRAGPSRR
jgi:hypothetical protein